VDGRTQPQCPRHRDEPKGSPTVIPNFHRNTRFLLILIQ
jgi:hypothetical protein